MPDVCELILEQHARFRRWFGDLDELRREGVCSSGLDAAWRILSGALELHATVEEHVFYPELLRKGDRGREETADALQDHADIRDAIGRSGEAEVGSDAWWGAVHDARSANSEHMAEEETGALADLRTSSEIQAREQLGRAWQEFERRAAAEPPTASP